MSSQENYPTLSPRHAQLYAKVEELTRQITQTQTTLQRYEGRQHRRRRTPYGDSDDSHEVYRQERRVHDLYQERISKSHVKFPKFLGESDPELYFEWEGKVEQILNAYTFENITKVKLITLEFENYALVWWNQIKNEVLSGRRLAITTWHDLQMCMRDRFVHSFYRKKLYVKLQRLVQEARSVEEYYKELRMSEKKALKEKEKIEKELKEKKEKEFKEREAKEKEKLHFKSHTEIIEEESLKGDSKTFICSPTSNFESTTSLEIITHVTSIVLLPSEDLYIKEQWQKQWGEEKEIMKDKSKSMDEDAYGNVSKVFVYDYTNLHGHSTICAKLYGQITCFDFCKDCLHRNFVHYNSNEKLLSKNNRNLRNSKDSEQYFITLRRHWFVFDPGIQRGKEVCKYY